MANAAAGRVRSLFEGLLLVRKCANARTNSTPSVRWSQYRTIHESKEHLPKLQPPGPGRRDPARRVLSTSAPARSIQQPGAEARDEPDTSKTTEDDIRHMFTDIVQELSTTDNQLLKDIASYYFDGQGKAVRPMITCLTARAINSHAHPHRRFLLPSQRRVAMITEMIHTASLVHDDVIDASDTRRGKASVNKYWGQKRAIMAGDYILSVASTMLARIRNDDVTLVLSQVLADLVQGEFMQLGSKENENERFAHYLRKTFKKTASLIAYSCKAVAILGGADDEIQEVAFQYGRNVGMAFQLVDDLLDFVSSSNLMGKPAAADLRLGLATAPVLFACEKFPELNPMIMRRFTEPGDVEKAYRWVMDSEGPRQTRILAETHCAEAIRHISQLQTSPEQRSLVQLTDRVLNRMK
ncbi:decaprenyl-diphosphate synthase subunit 1-like isoform X1 [Pollicipes pollicipes]|uniref:decaprenyl-diphosphate synthase subunit 1-like isoform X1 n=2 Tax=Pollicipes pollicipes TaxID=41117 RepID=UPI0018859380|nr:decaprenyl-diphosphate synthase subunit 1-like isoform X1 [Pollicipes pollicipes]